MTLQEFNEINWQRGNVARLENGKEYLVKGVKGHGKYILLFSEEYEKCFVADYRIVECRTSDYAEPEEIYLEEKRKKREEAEAKLEAERLEARQRKAERKQRNIEAQERAHQEALARKAAAKAERQKAKENKEKTQPKAEPKAVVKPQPKAEAQPIPKAAEASKAVSAEAPATEAPKKRVRQRIRISSATPIREKVVFNKKK